MAHAVLKTAMGATVKRGLTTANRTEHLQERVTAEKHQVQQRYRVLETAGRKLFTESYQKLSQSIKKQQNEERSRLHQQEPSFQYVEACQSQRTLKSTRKPTM